MRIRRLVGHRGLPPWVIDKPAGRASYRKMPSLQDDPHGLVAERPTVRPSDDPTGRSSMRLSSLPGHPSAAGPRTGGHSLPHTQVAGELRV